MDMISCSTCNASRLKEDYVFCPYCGKPLAKPGKCTNCGHQNASSAKFCQECGLSLQTNRFGQTEIPKAPLLEEDPIPTSGITIEFGYSSSTNFDFAVQAAEVFPSFRTFGEGKKALYRINFDQSEIVSTIELVKFARGWKSSRIYVNGEKTTWDAVYSFLWCYERRCASFKPDLYCFGYENEYDLNIWGCTQARMPFREHANWVEWGQWLDNNGNWQFDKERIRHELQKELFPYRFCPAIQLDLVEDALTAFPEKVNPRKNKNWKFVESWGDDGLSTGLVVTVDRYGYADKVTMKGVAPNGKGALQEVIKRMKHKLPKEVMR